MSDFGAKKAELEAQRAQVMDLAARRYAAADRTDPFAYRRAVTHIKSGVAQFAVSDDQGNLIPAYYDAQGYQEKRSYTKTNGELVEYAVPAWKNMIRP